MGFKQYRNGFKKVSGGGRIRVRWHRPYPGQIKTCCIVRKAGCGYVSLMCAVSEPLPLPESGRVIGINMGIKSLITTNDGKQVHNHCKLERS
jgi:putative transposase